GAHHLNCAASKPKQERPHRTRARPVDRIFQAQGHHPHVTELLGYSHSNPPTFHSYMNPTVSTKKNTPMTTNPYAARSRNTTAHGMKKITSMSNRMNSTATR